MKKLQIPTKSFRTFLKAVSKINTSVLLTVKNYKIEALVSSDLTPLILLAEVSLPQVSANDVDIKLPVIDITKLQKMCEFIKTDTFELIIENNVIRYSNDNVKLKFHLAEERIINVPQQVTAEKFKAFPKDFSTTISYEALSNLEKGFSLVKSTDIKAYFFVEDNKFYGELTDDNTHGMDSFRIKLSDEYHSAINGRIPIKFESLLALSLTNSDIIIESSIIARKNLTCTILFFTQKTDNLEVSYMLQPMKA